MANTKLDRIERDIEKTRAKILEQQKKLKDLEAQKVEEENAQIVQMVKAVHLDGTQLAAFLSLTPAAKSPCRSRKPLTPPNRRTTTMKNKKIIRKFTVLLAALVIMCGFSVTAYAGGGDESDDTPTPVTEETPAPETEPEETTGGYEPQPLTPDGNMSLVDDITGEASGDKQFITVVTKSGNYFYIIIDRAEDGENTVHFLNQVDEADLTALMEDGQTEAPVCSCTDKCVAGSVNTACPVCSVNMSECAGVEAEPEPEETEQPPEEEKGGGMGILLVVLLVAAAGGGAFYYFKILKPKKDAAKGSSSLDDLDFDEDDEETEVVETEQTEQEDDNL